MNLPYPEDAAAVGASAERDGSAAASTIVTNSFGKLFDRSPQREYTSDYQQQSILRSWTTLIDS